MHPSDTTFAQEVSQAITRYKNYSSSGCLFHSRGVGDQDQYGLYVECQAVGMQFFDTISWESDSKGLLFYDSVSSFSKSNTLKYVVYKNEESPPAVRIDFFGGDGPPVSTLLTNDTNHLPSEVFTKSSEGSGGWGLLETGSSHGYIYKDASRPTVTIAMHPIRKQVSFDVPSDNANMNIGGVFTYIDALDFKDNKNVKAYFTANKIVFYRYEVTETGGSSITMMGQFTPNSPIPSFAGLAPVAASFSDI